MLTKTSNKTILEIENALNRDKLFFERFNYKHTRGIKCISVLIFGSGSFIVDCVIYF